MTQYKEKRYPFWPNPEKLIQDIKNYFEDGYYSVEIIYNDADNSLIIRIWNEPAYNIENHGLIPDLD